MIRKIYLSIMALILVAMLTLVFTGCNNTEDAPKPTNGIIDFTLSAEEAELDRYETLMLTVSGIEDAVTWESSATAVATVVNGVVTPAGTGTAVITAKVGTVSKTCPVKVTDSGAVPVISFNRTAIEVLKDGTLSLTAQVKYKNNPCAATVTLTSADTAIATIANGIVTGVAIGNTSINATATYMGLTLTDSIAVGVKFDGAVILSQSQMTLYTKLIANADFETTGEVTAYAEQAGVRLNDVTFTYTSDDEQIATVSSTGNITAVKDGETYIRVSCTVDSVVVYADVALTVEKSYVSGDNLEVDRLLSVNTVSLTDYPGATSVMYRGEVISDKEGDVITIKNSVIENLGDALYDVQIQTDDMYYAVKMDIFSRYSSIDFNGFVRTMPLDDSLTTETDNLSWTNVSANYDDFNSVYRYATTAGAPAWDAYLKEWKDMIQANNYQMVRTNKYLVFELFVPKTSPVPEFRMYCGSDIIAFSAMGVNSAMDPYVTIVNADGNEVPGLKKGEWLTVIVDVSTIGGEAAQTRLAFTTNPYTAAIKDGSYEMFIADIRTYKENRFNIECGPMVIPTYTSIGLAGFGRAIPLTHAWFANTDDNLSWTDVSVSYDDFDEAYRYATTEGGDTWSENDREWADMIQLHQYDALKRANKYLVYELYIPETSPAPEFRMYCGNDIIAFGEAGVNAAMAAYVTIVDADGNEVPGLVKGEWLTVIVDISTIGGDASATRLAFTTNPYNANIKAAPFEMVIADLRAYTAEKFDISYVEYVAPSYTVVPLSSISRTMPRDDSLTIETDNLSWTDVSANYEDFNSVYRHATTAGVPTWDAYLREWKDMVDVQNYQTIKTNKYLVYNVYISETNPAAEYRMYCGDSIIIFRETGLDSTYVDKVTIVDADGNEVAGIVKGEWQTIIVDVSAITITEGQTRLGFTTNPWTASIKSAPFEMFIADLRTYATAEDLDVDYVELT